MNVNSAVDRVKNSLSYKLGEAMIAYDKRGGGLYSLLTKLYSLKKEHRKKTKIYKDIIQVFPSLKYPALEKCADYKASLRCKFHLSYLLGQALIRADKEKFSGGYIRLFSYIKEAKEIFRSFSLFEEFDINLDLLFENLASLSGEQREIFKKEYLVIKDIFERHKDYKELLDNILRNFGYFLDNFKSIEAWLKSDEFYENFKNKKHPYPSLLNPKEINYDDISAELAFSLYLPLQPDRCNFVWFCRNSTGLGAISSFFGHMKVDFKPPYAYWDVKSWYLFLYEDKNRIISVEIGLMYILYHFIPKDIKLFCVYRDPISYIKHMINHVDWKIIPGKKIINLRTNLKSENLFSKSKNVTTKTFTPCVSSLEHPWVLDYMLNFHKAMDVLDSKNKEVYMLEFEDINFQNAFDTFTKLAYKFGFNPPSNKELFQHRANRSNGDLFTLPVTFVAHKSDLDYIYDENKEDHKENESSFNMLGGFKILITTYQLTPERDKFLDITKEIFADRELMFKNLILLIKRDKYKAFKRNERLFLASKQYINSYVSVMEKYEQEINDKLITEEDILEYLRDYKDLRNKYKTLIEEDLRYVKKYHPEYIQKWKYYQEFLKLCEKDELETKDEN